MYRRFASLLFYWLLLALIAPNIGLSITEDMGVLGKIANTLLPLGMAGILASLSKKIGRTALLFIPLFVFGAFQLVLLGLYGEGVIAVDMFLNVLTTNPREAGELLGNMAPPLIAVAIIYVPPIAGGIYACAKRIWLTDGFRIRCMRISAVAACAGLASMGAAYMLHPGYAISDDLYPVNIGYNMYLAYDRTMRTKAQTVTSAGFVFGSKPTHDPGLREIYVLVIGETSRAYDWQLTGYGRPTNPKLSKRSDIVYCRNAFSESNTTHKSVPMLLSLVSAANFDKDIYSAKSVITAFKEAGFNTAFISNQLPNHSIIDRFAYEADTVVFVREHLPEMEEFDDFLVMQQLSEALAQANRKQLVVLHTYGSHFNYLARYKKSNAVFFPDVYTTASKEYRQELVNAYDNTIINTDAFLDSVIEKVDSVGCLSGLLYASDHGEDIFENGTSFLHASPVPTIQQLHVPFLIWLSSQYRSAYPDAKASLERNSSLPVSTSRSYCPTALDIAGIYCEMCDTAAALSARGFTPLPRVYLNDHNEAVPIEDIK